MVIVGAHWVELRGVNGYGAWGKLAPSLGQGLDQSRVQSAVSLALAITRFLKRGMLNVLAGDLFDGNWLGRVVKLRGQLLETLQLELILIVIVLISLYLSVPVLGRGARTRAGRSLLKLSLLFHVIILLLD